jgi:hypothetical protein
MGSDTVLWSDIPIDVYCCLCNIIAIYVASTMGSDKITTGMGFLSVQCLFLFCFSGMVMLLMLWMIHLLLLLLEILVNSTVLVFLDQRGVTKYQQLYWYSSLMVLQIFVVNGITGTCLKHVPQRIFNMHHCHNEKLQHDVSDACEMPRIRIEMPDQMPKLRNEMPGTKNQMPGNQKVVSGQATSESTRCLVLKNEMPETMNEMLGFNSLSISSVKDSCRINSGTLDGHRDQFGNTRWSP